MIKQWHPLDAATRTTAAPEPTERQQARRRAYAKLLCLNAKNQSSWALADKMAARFGCESCTKLGVPAPIE
jgi:hypothetical protein